MQLTGWGARTTDWGWGKGPGGSLGFGLGLGLRCSCGCGWGWGCCEHCSKGTSIGLFPAVVTD